MTATVSCALCGKTTECADGSIPKGWSIEVVEARVQHLCLPCVRSNIRSIESKLPNEYW